jgi:hypothetical protein
MATVFIPSPTLVAQVRVDPMIAMTMEMLGEAYLFETDRLAPVGETGRLKASLRNDPIPGNGRRISVNVDYWFFPEYGVNQRPQPYLRVPLTSLGFNLT